MALITELKYNDSDFNDIDLDDLIVVFEGDITVVHYNNFSEKNINKIIDLLQRLCNKFNNMTYEIFSENGKLKPLYSKNYYENIMSAIMQFSGFPKLIIGEIEESSKYDGWTLYIDNDWYDVLNSKELYQLVRTNLLSKYFESVTINDKEYKLEDLISIKDNKMDDIPLANPLYHGTCEKYLLGILQKGLRKIQDNSVWTANNDGYVFLTTDYQTAQIYANIYAKKTNSHSVVIEIDSNYLNRDNIVLDYDFTNSFTELGSKSPYNGGEVTYSKHYKGNIASNDKRYGTKFNKIGYKGVVMPKAIKNITIGKYSITPQEYLEKYHKENNVMESKQNIREWHYPDNFDSLPDTIILYHGTDYDGMENILIDGVIDARRGRSTGETRGMNWFFTSYRDNYSRGFVYSIDINKEEINKTSNGFNYMNDNEIASYEPITIDNRNFTIHEAFGYGIENLKNVMWRKCLQQTNNDIYEAIYLWIDKFSKLSGAQEYDISINNVIIQQILKQFIGEDELRNQGIIENIEHINEVNSSNINLSPLFNKIGYKGVVMPKSIKNNVMESKQNIREWYFPDNFENLPEKITLYHGTDFYSLEGILLDGVIDARNGRSTGETKGMNWFFTTYRDNYSRGFMYSIDIDKDEIGKTNDGFRYMNDGAIANYEPIPINNRNFTIHEAFRCRIEDLNEIWERCLQQTNNDISEAIHLWIDQIKVICRSEEYEMEVDINSEIITQILKQFIGENELRNRGMIESKDHINEVNSSNINLSSFKPKTELHPKLWVNNKLNSRVRLRLLDIADDFIDTLAVDWVKPKDIVFTGSLANYNWSRYSDIDIHVIIDYNKVYKKKEFVEDYFSSKKELWIDNHPKLSIYGFPIELYVEDSNEPSASSGIYSLNKNEWIKEPVDFEDAKLNVKYIKNYAAKLMTQIDNIEKKQENTNDDYKVEQCRKELLKIFDRLKKLRKEGLNKGGEMSSGNIIFKILRRTKYIDKIWDLINTSYDKINSIKENKLY